MKREILEGKIQGNERGYGFLIVDGKTEDYFIPHSDLRGAMHGDRVLCETVEDGLSSGERTVARVLKVLERGIKEISGTYFTSRKGGFVVPDDKRYFKDIFIPFGKGLRAKAGDKVAVKILSYPKKQNPEGIISKIFGRQFNKNAELDSLIYSYGLKTNFEKPELEEAERVAKPIDENALKGRKDLRDIITFTIDGEDAKDFDDAVSIEKLSNGAYKLGVHIADVSHYVKENSCLDRVAFERATSVYFPEKVIPMLPERICNDVCSLLECKDRLTLSAIITVNEFGKVIDSEITPSVIRSKHRLTYENVQKILDGDSELIKQYSDIYEDLILMSNLADILTEKRAKDGSIDLDVKESAIYVDKYGEIIVNPQVQTKSRKIIEEFMILANCTVAEFMTYAEMPFIYRVHEEPAEDKLSSFYEFIKSLGVKVRAKKGKVHSKDFQSILESVENTPNFTLINRVMLRSMQKAKYSPENLGHFGLSLINYCHFTSPIRRYPDLFIHRIIKEYLSGNMALESKYGESVYVASEQSSIKERNAIEVERAVDEYYKLLYLTNHEGEEFDGIISGVIAKGFFVELYNGVEGFVDGETNFRKRAIFDKNNYTYTVGKKTYKLGEKVKIAVGEVDLIAKRAEFVIID
ncbi:MAG: ribonuclease R [Clostridia bacterium]|nr:ribonuclease R [Clostridia bacterium]